mmetsp:Transcript_94299/g.137665  ORF Transcript_94299/g.137665 Transcript_94299/m.137665 type:complete len:116 (-) Transcript_94299:9-356(-)
MEWKCGESYISVRVRTSWCVQGTHTHIVSLSLTNTHTHTVSWDHVGDTHTFSLSLTQIQTHTLCHGILGVHTNVSGVLQCALQYTRPGGQRGHHQQTPATGASAPSYTASHSRPH